MWEAIVDDQFVARILAVHKLGEPADVAAPGMPRVWRVRLAGPGHGRRTADVLLTMRCGERGVLKQSPLRSCELEAEGAADGDVPGDVVDQHGDTSGHGCAISASIAMSTLA
jgi:hypothetical protein